MAFLLHQSARGRGLFVNLGIYTHRQRTRSTIAEIVVRLMALVSSKVKKERTVQSNAWFSDQAGGRAIFACSEAPEVFQFFSYTLIGVCLKGTCMLGAVRTQKEE